MKFYKDSDGAFWIDGELTYKGKYCLKVDEESQCIALIDNLTRTPKYAGCVTGISDYREDSSGEIKYKF